VDRVTTDIGVVSLVSGEWISAGRAPDRSTLGITTIRRAVVSDVSY
jgi:hypothetical protein